MGTFKMAEGKLLFDNDSNSMIMNILQWFYLKLFII